MKMDSLGLHNDLGESAAFNGGEPGFKKTCNVQDSAEQQKSVSF